MNLSLYMVKVVPLLDQKYILTVLSTLKFTKHCDISLLHNRSIYVN